MAADAPHLVQGRAAEDAALMHLKRQGLKLIARNYRTQHGEIDLIMRDARTLVFVEVRFRRDQRFGSPAETVGVQKQRKLRASAEHYLQADGDCNRPCRFDIVSVSGDPATPTIDWLTNAF
ncbi:MAG: hypothetical protein AMJ84_09275 [Acidithiobacillales bacterium SM23_46]|jgi:putative endonuclease|nr:MAG: hypothetical protein AMJ84_09275 [Acidithiobacillales bacterium SM23_46]KPL28609.1 MAG: hypothetical protein AMJ72_02415 [Acidithiobacillales bacterium SM1_46]